MLLFAFKTTSLLMFTKIFFCCSILESLENNRNKDSFWAQADALLGREGEYESNAINNKQSWGSRKKRGWNLSRETIFFFMFGTAQIFYDLLESAKRRRTMKTQICFVCCVSRHRKSADCCLLSSISSA